jgi:hypothetical protein
MDDVVDIKPDCCDASSHAAVSPEQTLREPLGKIAGLSYARDPGPGRQASVRRVYAGETWHRAPRFRCDRHVRLLSRQYHRLH